MNIKRVWYNNMLVFSNKQNVWLKDWALMTYWQDWWANAGDLQVYANWVWTNVPADWNLEYYDSFDPTYAGTSEDTLIATATFMNWDVTLQTVTVADWWTPVYTGDTPTKEADAENTYTFSWWNPALWPISKDTTYVAEFTATPIG